MKNISIKIIAVLLVCSFFACKKDEVKTVMTVGPVPTVTLSPSTVVLDDATAADTVQTISWTKSDYGFSSAENYTVMIAKAGTDFAGAQQINVGSNLKLKLTGNYLNNLAITAGITAGSDGQLEVKVKSSLSDSVATYSEVQTLALTTYKTLYPALQVQGGNSWVTPGSRTNGYVLTSPNYDGKYEGYLNLPNADGYGGDAFKLISSTTGTVYGWGSNPVPSGSGFSVDMVENAGNLWLTPAPNFIKVDADINTMKLNYVPTSFFISGDDNGWSTSATPMTFDAATNTLKATNVTLTAGKSFVFTCNGGYDISYKVDASNQLIFAGPPAWAGNNISIPASGVFTVILDLSGGNGSYTYKIQ